MRVTIRTDSSVKIGTGHVMRCLTLANILRMQGADVEFICKRHTGSLIPYIQKLKYNVHILKNVQFKDLDTYGSLFHSRLLGGTQKNDAKQCLSILKNTKPDLLIVDHYAIDQEWEKILKSTYKNLLVIDDLGDRSHVCDFLLDQNYGSTVKKYQALVPKKCLILLGPNYALLRPEFSKYREYSLGRRKNNKAKRILITFGGIDPDNYTGRVLKIFKKIQMPDYVNITVIMSSMSPFLKESQDLAKTMHIKTEVKVDVSNMAEIMMNSDIAIGAAGSTAWERCCLGLPTIQMVIAKNQEYVSRSLVQVGAVRLLERLDQIPYFIKNVNEWMLEVGEVASQVCDGLGANKVVKILTTFQK
jgi:UDP-2,4-diacetamido-2,4,6-trideoxy-beta-L-altropyranose hydrolase